MGYKYIRKTVRQLVEEGIESKVNKLTDESQVKLQDTIQKVINDSNGGLVVLSFDITAEFSSGHSFHKKKWVDILSTCFIY